jgi:hypothetical protein
MPRHVPPKIQAIETDNKAVEVQREKDRLFFIENPHKRFYFRPYVPHEAVAYTMPEHLTVVRVTRIDRTFVVGGITTLVVDDVVKQEKRTHAKKSRRTHQIYDFKRVQHDKPDPAPAVDREARALAERKRQAERRAVKEQQRQQIMAAKRGA